MSLHEDRQHQLLRLFLIADSLERGEDVTRRKLADFCQCSTRTVGRDLTFLKGMGVAIEYDARKHTYRLQSPLPFQTVQFSLPEVMALAMAREWFAVHDNLPFTPTLRTAFSRLITRLPPSLRSTLEETQNTVSFSPRLQRDYSRAPWQELTEAAKRRETVEICYHSLSSNRMSFRCVDPYLLAERDGYMMLVGYCEERKQVLEFPLDRIRQLKMTGQTFSIRPGFQAAEYLKGAIGALRGEPTRIVVRFDAMLAPYARQRQWQFPHQMEEGADGTLLLRGEVSGEKGILNELLSWGAGIEVLEPNTLRQAIYRSANATAKRHKK